MYSKLIENNKKKSMIKKFEDAINISLAKYRLIEDSAYLVYSRSIQRLASIEYMECKDDNTLWLIIVVIAFKLKNARSSLSSFEILRYVRIFLFEWIKQNEVDIYDIESICKKIEDIIEKSIMKEHRLNILDDRIELTKEYFRTYDKADGTDIVKVFYPGVNRTWIDWNISNSIDIKVSLDNGLELGFFLVGFDYELMDTHGKNLKVAYEDTFSRKEYGNFTSHEIALLNAKTIWST